MKRLMLCGIALLLTSGALAPRAADAFCSSGCDSKTCLRNCLIIGSEGGTCVLVSGCPKCQCT